MLILITPRKPAQFDSASGQLKNLISNPGAGATETDSPELAALRKRYESWWRPTSNVLKTLHNLGDDDVLKEFRRGDVKFLDLDERLSMEGSQKSPGPSGLINTLVENMYF